jgi:hypothetical protein
MRFQVGDAVKHIEWPDEGVVVETLYGKNDQSHKGVGMTVRFAYGEVWVAVSKAALVKKKTHDGLGFGVE